MDWACQIFGYPEGAGDLMTKRALKRGVNFFKDPPPRSQQLILKDVLFSDDALRYRLEVRGETLEHSFLFDDATTALLRDADLGEMQGILACLGLLITPMYFQLGDFAAVHCEIAGLDEEGLRSFEEVILDSLGEFRMKMGLDPTRRVEVTAKSAAPPLAVCRRTPMDKALLMNGGGKDTVVAVELLKALQVPFVWCSQNKNTVRSNVIMASGIEEEISFTMRRDEALFKAPRYPYGNHAVAQILSGVSVLLAYLHGFRYVVFGNEYSANFGNLTFRGMNINHQYGKCIKFEKVFSRILKSYALEDVHYFSLLRPFHDIALGRLFARFPAYHDKFVSCNRAIHKNAWCNSCPKCAFTFLVLYPFLGEEEITEIFGENLFYNETIRREIWKLVADSVKPWECVGTQEESRLALALALEKLPDGDFSSWPRRADFSKLLGGTDQSRDHLFRPVDGEHCLPPAIARALPAVLAEILGDRA